MILHDVANGADLFVERAPALNSELLGHGDLHILHIHAIPDRLEKGIGEAEIQKILHRLLAQVVIDAKYGFLGKHLVQRGVQRLGAGEIAAERLFDDHAGPVRAAGLREPLHDARKQAGRNRQIVDGTNRGALIAA